MAQLALYRKYRSQTFEDLVGQGHVVKTLQNALATGRTAQAFLFTGPRGTGKTSSARLLAKALNCEKGPTPTPCNQCESCRLITEGNHPDVIELDAASDAGVDDVREKIIETCSYVPMMGSHRIFIIDEVHDLSAKAFDALLKTIEEPPAHMVFVLATTEYNKVPPTIRSRTQKYEFHRASIASLIERLNYVIQQEGVTADSSAVHLIARMADGGFRDALTLLEQAMLVSDGPISVDVIYDQLGLVSESLVDDLLSAIRQQDVAMVVTLIDTVVQSGRDPRAIVESLLHRLADLTRASFQVQASDQEAALASALHEQAGRLGRDWILEIRGRLAESHKVIRDISLPRLWLESELIKLASRPGSSAVGGSKSQQPAPSPAPAQERPAVPKGPVVSDSVPIVSPAGMGEAEAFPDPVVAKSQTDSAAPTSESLVRATGGDIWERLLSLVPDTNPKTGQPFIMKKKLEGSKLVADESDRIVVGIPRQMNLEWLRENPSRVGYLKTFLAQLSREGTSIELVLDKPALALVDHSNTVEFPLEGEALMNAVKSKFQSNGDPGQEPGV